MYLSLEEIDHFVEKYDQSTKALKQELFKMCWYMRGGLTWNEALHLSYDDRELIAKIIEENLEVTKETGQPFF